ncbi:LPS-assembly protein LptD [Chitinophaga parva]|uniref:LPS-assembly protein LptD n=2 Tax=Chitinophaga parva TaxID=2169414 RepID=A0A2T7BBK8_9BACT|nr:LPS-assembly protein LptD [Chitinophaga parva]
MHARYKNNYKKFFRSLYLLLAGIILVFPFILDTMGHPVFHALHPSAVYASPDTVPARKPVKAAAKAIALNNDTTHKPGTDSSKKAADSAHAAPQDSIPAGFVTEESQRNVDTVHVKLSKDSLDAPVNYKARDSIVLVVPEKKFYLYGNANTKYKDVDLTADKMDYAQGTGVMHAMPSKDTAGKLVGRPVMVNGGQTFDSDTLLYNIGSQKALIYNTRSQYGEGFIASQVTKKAPDNTIFGFKNGYTTCNLDTPHFAFRARKIKVIPNKLVISGPANLEIMGIPTPLYIPFAIFPLSTGQRSGLLPPQYTTNVQKGLGLENGGYYIGLGDNFDMTLRGSVFSYGSWALTAAPTYRVRYRYSGGMTLSFSNTRFGDPAVKQDFSTSRDFHVTWNHTMDSKARPGTTFGASVNFGTSSYNKYNVTDYNTRVNNNIGSSITFSKSWQGKPYNLSLGLTHSQNLQTRDMTVSFPNAAFTVNTIYPFQPKEVVGTPKWYYKIGVGYTGNLQNSVSIKDSLFGKQQMWDAMQTGFQHNVPISLSLPVMKGFTLSPGISFSDRWYTKEIIRTWNPGEYNPARDTLGKIDTTYRQGFFQSPDVSASISLTTALYGMYQFHHSKVHAIRHVLRPTLGMSYRPDLNKKYFYDLRYGNRPEEVQRVSYFDGSNVGAPSSGASGAINFGIDNNLEMKVYSKKDTSALHEKKVKLLDGFGINGSYNLLADSQKLSNFSLYARTNLFDKLNITAAGTLDPYVYDAHGLRTNRYVWQDGALSLGHLTSASIALSTSLTSQSKKAKEKEKQLQDLAEQQNTDAAALAQKQQATAMRTNPADYVDFDIPWKVDISYSLSYNKSFSLATGQGVTTFTQAVTLNGDFSLTPKWKLGAQSSINLNNFQPQYSNLYVSRDLHCWQMSINVVPYGFLRSFSITIQPKAGILRDLRVNRAKSFYDQ